LPTIISVFCFAARIVSKKRKRCFEAHWDQIRTFLQLMPILVVSSGIDENWTVQKDIAVGRSP
jgi:hypothetical protein